jgi:hypothetical protein
MIRCHSTGPWHRKYTTDEHRSAPMTVPTEATITAWRCIGCGRIEAPAPCVGVCEDRKVELVTAWDYAEALSELEDARERLAALEAVVTKLARTRPREGAWKESYVALQQEARAALAGLARTGEASGGG